MRISREERLRQTLEGLHEMVEKGQLVRIPREDGLYEYTLNHSHPDFRDDKQWSDDMRQIYNNNVGITTVMQ